MAVIKFYSENAEFQSFAALKTNRNKRHRKRAFFVEGVRNINAAIKYQWHIDAYIYSRGRQLSKWALGAMQACPGADLYELAPELMEKLSSKTDTSEIAAIVRMREGSFVANAGVGPLQGSCEGAVDDSASGAASPNSPASAMAGGMGAPNPVYVLLDRPSGKGNLGTIMRSCDVFGVEAMFCAGHSVDFYDPEVVAASMGSLFVTPFYPLGGAQELDSLFSLLRKAHPGIAVIGTSSHAEQAVHMLDLNKPLLLLIGSEADGLSWRLAQMADTMAAIPMGRASYATSLNIGCATAALLYEAARQRG